MESERIKRTSQIDYVSFFTRSSRESRHQIKVVMKDGSRYYFTRGRMASDIEGLGLDKDFLEQVEGGAFEYALSMEEGDDYAPAQKLLHEFQEAVEARLHQI